MREGKKCRRNKNLAPGGGGGGGGTSICMHIGYVPQKRPPFSALNFRSGAYHFNKFPNKSVPEHHHFPFFGGFCRSGDHHFQNFFNFNPFIASHGRLSPNAAPRVSQTRPGSFGESRPFTAPRVSQTHPGSSGESHFHAKTDQARSGAPPIFKLKLVPETHTFTLDRELVPEPLPFFHFAAAHSYQNLGWVPPPPPPPPRVVTQTYSSCIMNIASTGTPFSNTITINSYWCDSCFPFSLWW